MTPSCGSGCARRRARGARRARPRRCIVGSDIDAEAVRMAIANGERGRRSGMDARREARRSAAVTAPRGRAGTHRDQSALRGAHRRRVGLARALFRARAAAARAVSRMAGGDPHRQSAAGAQSRDLREAHAPGVQRHHRMPAAAVRSERGERGAAAPGEVRAEWSSRPGAQMFANRLRKNLERLEPWARAERIDCFRLYDADMPEYAFAIDHLWARAARTCTCRNTHRRRPWIRRAPGNAAARCLPSCPRSSACRSRSVHSRVRKPQKGSEQYEKRVADGADAATSVEEGGPQVLGEFSRLPGHGTVPRSPYHPPDAARLGQGCGFPQSVLLHGKRHGVRRRRRRALERERRSVEHLSRLGARQSGAERIRAVRGTSSSAPIASSGWRARRRRGRASI